MSCSVSIEGKIMIIHCAIFLLYWVSIMGCYMREMGVPVGYNLFRDFSGRSRNCRQCFALSRASNFFTCIFHETKNILYYIFIIINSICSHNNILNGLYLHIYYIFDIHCFLLSFYYIRCHIIIIIVCNSNNKFWQE